MTAKPPDILFERYLLLLEITSDLASTLDLDVLLNRIVNAAADLSDSEAASILLYDTVKQELHFHASTNLDTPLMRGLTVPVEGSVAGWIVTNRKPRIVADVNHEPDGYFEDVAKTVDFPTRSILGVPMITKDKVVGVLEVLNKRSGTFSPDDQELLSALGAQAAVAIENTRLFQQSDLIADLVHELRTPLASLNTAAHILLRPEVSEEQRSQMVETIQQETLRLTEMTTSFLDLARLESGRIQFRIQELNLNELLEESVRVIQGRAREAGLTLETSLPEQIITLQGDRDKLKQVLLNLLSNAIKYNWPNGKVILSAAVDEKEAIITVKDTGRGIPPEYLPDIFEKFYRVPGMEKAAVGTGLGLAITKRIVEAHAGRIEVESQVGVGSTFRIWLPLRAG